MFKVNDTLLNHSRVSLVRTLAVIDGVVPNGSINVKTDQRLVKSIVGHLEPSVARDCDHRVVHHVHCTQFAVVWCRQLRAVYH